MSKKPVVFTVTVKGAIRTEADLRKVLREVLG